MPDSVTIDDINRLVGNDSGMRAIAVFTVPGEPLSKARARFTNYGSKVRSYTPERTKAGEARVKSAYLAAVGEVETDADLAFRVEADFYSGTRQRRDVDNMLKLVLDGLNGVAWPDDVQVLELSGRKSFVTKAEARTVVTIFTLDGGMNRPVGTCVNCGNPFRTYASWSARKTCSPECTAALRVRPAVRECKACGSTWEPKSPRSEANYCSTRCRRQGAAHIVRCTICGAEHTTYRSWSSGNNYCSDACTLEGIRRVREARKSTRMPGTCVDCGTGTTKAHYKRCRPCSAIARRNGRPGGGD